MLRVIAWLCLCLIVPSLVFAEDSKPPSMVDIRKVIADQQRRGSDQAYYGVYIMGKKVGWDWIQAKQQGSQYVIQDHLHLKMTGMGSSTEMDTSSRRIYDMRTGNLVDVRAKQKGQMGNATFHLYRTEDAENFLFDTVVGEQKRSVPMEDQGESLPGTLWMDYLVFTKSLKPGHAVTSKQFDPTTGRWLTQSIAYERSETKLFNGVETTIHAFTMTLPELGIQTQTITDEHGQMLETKIGGLMTLRLESKEQAKSDLYEQDVLVATTIQPQGKSLRGGRKAKRVRYHIEGLSPRWRVNTSQQSWSADGQTLTVSVQAEPAKPNAALAGMEKLHLFLKADARIQSDHEAIRKQVDSILREIHGPARQAEALSQWVYKNLKKEYSAVFSNALDTLREKRGDCGEHAVLLTALLRAAGIPAREVGGLIYSESLQGFGFHAWAQAYYKGQWHDLDPSWNQSPVDPLHIALGFGSMEELTGAVLGGSSMSIRVDELSH